MRRNKLLLGVTCLTASTALFAGTAHADRRTGLAGNILIQDPDDLFPFPQYTLTHRNMIRLDYGGASTSGNGVLTLGDENMAFGVALHRGDLLSPDVVGFNQELAWLGGVVSPFGDTTFGVFDGAAGGAGTVVQPATVFDLFYGRSLGDNLLGLRLGFGRGVDQVKVDGDVTKGAQSFITAQLGYSMLPPDGLRLDLSGNITAVIGKSTAADDDVNSGYEVRLGLLGRGYYPINDVVDVGFLGNIQLDNEHSSSDPADDSSNDFTGALFAGAGPAINLERAHIAAYAGLNIGFNTNEPSDETDDDETSALAFAAPAVNMAAEIQVLDWLFVRTGAQYIWGLNRTKSTVAGGDDSIAKTTTGTFNWSAGLGFTKNNFYFDGVIANAFVTNGPAFIGGNDPGFLAMASATYKFGDVFSGAGTPAPAPEQVVEPVPAPEPAPAPVQEAAPPSVDPNASGAVDTTGGAAGAAGDVNAGASATGSIGIGR